MRISKHIAFVLTCTGLVLFVPATALASAIYIDAGSAAISVGDTIVAGVYADVDTTSNVFEGAIRLQSIPPIFAVQEVSIAGSALTMWPQAPTLFGDGTQMRFVGGVPNGFKGQSQLLFNIVLVARAAGSASLSPEGVVVYLNDGKGTSAPVSMRPLALLVSPATPGVEPRNAWQPSAPQDSAPPERAAGAQTVLLLAVAAVLLGILCGWMLLKLWR